MSVIVITPPNPILAASDIRSGLGLGSTLSDGVLLALGGAAQGMLDGPRGTLGRAIGQQTLEYRFDRWDHHGSESRFYDPYRARVKLSGPDYPFYGYQDIPLPFPPVQSITSINYLDASGTLQTMDSSTYSLVGGGEGLSRIVANFNTTWPEAQLSPEAIKVRFVAGYTSIPPQLIQAMYLLVRTLYSMTSRDPALRVETVDGLGSRQFETRIDPSKAIDLAVEALIAPFRPVSL